MINETNIKKESYTSKKINRLMDKLEISNENLADIIIENSTKEIKGRKLVVGKIRFDKELKRDKLVLSEAFELVEEMNELEKYIKEISKNELIV